jgi:hypothetical protein
MVSVLYDIVGLGTNIKPPAAERLELIDFADAAGEWGSIVPLPASEAKRMVALADGRHIADLDQR